MTFTARMAVLVSRHRILAYALGTLALTAYLVLGLVPNAMSAPENFDSPADIIGSAKGSCAYLTICRWGNLSTFGEPPIIGIPLLFIVNMMYAVAHFIFFILAQAFIFVGNLSIYQNLLYFGDGVFSKVALVQNNELMVGSLVGTLLFAVVIIAAFVLIRGTVTGKNGNMSPTKTIGWMVGGLIVLSVMASASAKNHDGTSAIARLAAADDDAAIKGVDQASIHSEDIGEASKDPNSWQPYSLGWVIAWGNTAAAGVANLGVSAITTITNSMDLDETAIPSSCDIYVESMHDLYTGKSRAVTPEEKANASQTSNAVIELERLYRGAVLDQYIMTNFGGSVGAKGAWCRVMDMNTSVTQQVLISQNARKLPHGNVELYKPAIDVMIDDKLAWKVSPAEGKTSITGNKEFAGSNFGAGLAASFFSPVKFKSDDGTRIMHSTYFAMCMPGWQGGDKGKMVMNPEWASVIQAPKDSDAPLSDLKNEDGSNTVCSAMASGNAKGMPDGDTVAIGFMEKATDAEGNGGKTKYQERINYTKEEDSGNAILDLIFQGNASQQHKFIAASDGGVQGPAYNYFSSVSGSNWTGGFLSALVMMVVTVLIAKISFPVVLGGVVAQFLGATAMMVVAFSLMAVALWPTYRVRSFAVRNFAVIISGSLVSTLFTLIFLVYAGLFSFIRSVISVGKSNTMTGPVDFIINGLPILLAGIISYSLMKIILMKTLKFDPTNMKTALASSANAVMSPLSKDSQGMGQIMAAPFRSAASLVKTPVDVAKKSAWSGLRNAGSSVLDSTADILLKRSGDAANKNGALTPQGATSTANANPSHNRSNGTDADPLIPTFIHPPGTGASAGAGPNGAGGGFPAFGSTMTDEQHRQRLMDQIKSAYSTLSPDGKLPADFASVISKAPLSEVQRFADLLNSKINGSDAPRATPQQAADNMKKFSDMGAETLKTNPNGFDPNIGYAERAATQAQMFRGANPLNEKDIAGLSNEEKQNLDSRKFDLIGDSLPDGRSVSLGKDADVIKGEVVDDPFTSRVIPNAIVRSGSQSLEPLEGVTHEGTSIYGAKREKNEDGTFKEDWELSTLDSGARQLSTSMFSSAVPPAGVSEDQWEEVGDLHDWIKQNNLQLDSTAMSSWPAPRREQAGRVGDVLGEVMSASGVPMVNPDNLESLAESGVGVTSAVESFSFGEKVPDSDFKPSGMREALTAGKTQMAALESASMKRAELIVSEKVGAQLATMEQGLLQQEKALSDRLNERTSLVKNRAEVQLEGLLEALSESNAEEAQAITTMLRSGNWDEITEILNASHEDDENAEILKDEIRNIVENSKSRISSMDSDHRETVAQLYARLAEERESITEVMHRDIEAELENDIERNADSVRELAFSGASETSRRHVEGMLSWFPAIKSKFFSGDAHPDYDEVQEMDDYDGDGVDDRIQATL